MIWRTRATKGPGNQQMRKEQERVSCMAGMYCMTDLLELLLQ